MAESDSPFFVKTFSLLKLNKRLIGPCHWRLDIDSPEQWMVCDSLSLTSECAVWISCLTLILRSQMSVFGMIWPRKVRNTVFWVKHFSLGILHIENWHRHERLYWQRARILFLKNFFECKNFLFLDVSTGIIYRKRIAVCQNVVPEILRKVNSF